MSAPGRFTPCASAPHCVSSQAPADSKKHVAPFNFQTDRETARRTLIAVLADEKNARIVTTEPDFIHATFHSTLGFVDDVEFLIHADTIDVKSSSRIGYYDFGVNRRRVQHLRSAFQAALSEWSANERHEYRQSSADARRLTQINTSARSSC